MESWRTVGISLIRWLLNCSEFLVEGRVRLYKGLANKKPSVAYEFLGSQHENILKPLMLRRQRVAWSTSNNMRLHDMSHKEADTEPRADLFGEPSCRMWLKGLSFVSCLDLLRVFFWNLLLEPVFFCCFLCWWERHSIIGDQMIPSLVGTLLILVIQYGIAWERRVLLKGNMNQNELFTGWWKSLRMYRTGEQNKQYVFNNIAIR